MLVTLALEMMPLSADHVVIRNPDASGHDCSHSQLRLAQPPNLRTRKISSGAPSARATSKATGTHPGRREHQNSGIVHSGSDTSETRPASVRYGNGIELCSENVAVTNNVRTWKFQATVRRQDISDYGAGARPPPSPE